MVSDKHWSRDAVFYHIYPLGLCGAPQRNDFSSPPGNRLEKIQDWLPHIQRLGCSALYLGPLFESTSHGYDTADYNQVDRRLGSSDSLARLAGQVHRAGMRLVLDGVFNHVGRDFLAFKDLQSAGEGSPYCEWFAGLRFGCASPLGDPFTYQTWNGHFHLPRLNLACPAVREHLFEAVRMWISAFDIDGLRLDAADCLDMDFISALGAFCRRLKPDFWLMGEVIHGDYRQWACTGRLDSVTNYQAYKALYSSLAAKNYFEMAHTLERQFGAQGLYRGLDLYTFVDNHDVDRAAASLGDPAYLRPLYLLLFSMPGIPSIYYGSEWGLADRRTPHSDAALRPALELETARANAPAPGLEEDISRLAAVRRSLPALRYGSCQVLHTAPQQMAFLRSYGNEHVLVVLNAAEQPTGLTLKAPLGPGLAVDALNPGQCFNLQDGRLQLDRVEARWGRILVLQAGS